ncbi:MAG: hypothetical protein FJY26_12600, partial [Betaproteobacteria bacterium]|nr:hypothetical protein [Betaproteobacteria bacterium]
MNDDDLTGAYPEHSGAARRPAPRTTRHHSGPTEREAVLVDARFWAWLNDQDGEGDQATAAVEALQTLLASHGAR